LPPGQIVNQTFYLQVLERLRNSVVRVRREIANTWFLNHDNASSHTSFAVKEFLAQHNIQRFPTHRRALAWFRAISFYSPSSKPTSKTSFGTVENVQAAATRALNNIIVKTSSIAMKSGSWNRCIRSQGAYFEGDKLQLHICSIIFF